MTAYFNKTTGEHIATDTPAEWMGATEKPVPEHDKAVSSAIFNVALDDWEIVFAEPAAPVVPEVVTIFQAKAALYQAGLLETVQTTMEDPGTDMIARLAWQNAQEFRRSSPTVTGMATLFGWTEEQLDGLFITAAGIEA